MKSESSRSICILGCGGFIGSHLVERLLATTDHAIIGIDLSAAKIAPLLDNPRLSFVKLDVGDPAALAPYIDRCETVVSLAALCNPALYNTVPLDVIESNFTRPLELVKLCAARKKWLIHFSTCEVYGKTPAAITGTPMIAGPLSKTRAR